MNIPTDKKLEQFSVKGTPLQFATGDGEWQPNADMVAMKNICANDVQEGYTSKILQMLPNTYVSIEFEIPISYRDMIIKTSDGKVYTYRDGIEVGADYIINHTWDASKDIEPSYYSYKLRWYIVYFKETEPPALDVSDMLAFNSVYYCFNNIKYKGNLSGRNVEYFDLINGSKLIPSTFRRYFDSCKHLKRIPYIDTSANDDFYLMFNECNELEYIPELNTMSGTKFYGMFKHCKSLKKIPKLNTQNGTDFSYMFEYCESLRNIPQLNTDKGTLFNNMFGDCPLINNVPQLNTSLGENMQGMFYYNVYAQSIPELDFKNCKGSLSTIFSNSSRIEYLSIKNLSISIYIGSEKLSRDTIVNNVFSGLVDLTGQPQQTIELNRKVLAKLSEEDKAIATNKNWILK